MLIGVALGLAAQLGVPLALEAKVGVAPPTHLWLAERTDFVYPLAAASPAKSQAIWRSIEGQDNLTASETPMPTPVFTTRVAMAAATFDNLKLEDGMPVIPTVQWLVRGDPGHRPEPHNIATNKIGLKSEIRLLMDPTPLDLGSDVPMKFYVDGEAVRTGFTVVKPDGTVESRHTGPNGIGMLSMDQAGMWAIRFQQPFQGTLYTSTLFFESKNWESN
ncbi:MAG: hypothetical protein JST40_05210 [Armatimonadetes bacterium]|nr:hypothetical protein [Armatimonadota bacterium]